MVRTLRANACVLALVVAVTSVASAQYESGRKFVGPHIGLSGVGSAPSIGAQFEVAMDGRLGIGGFVDYWSYDFGNSFENAGVSYIALGATGSYHFEIDDDKWDPFVGLALGYFVVSWDDDLGDTGASSRIFLGGQGGVRYFFKDNIAFVARAGFGASYLSVGVDFAF